MIIDVRSASHPQISPRSSNSRFQARQGVVVEVADSFRQLMPAAMTPGVSSRSSARASFIRRASSRARRTMPGMGTRGSVAASSACTRASGSASARRHSSR